MRMLLALMLPLLTACAALPGPAPDSARGGFVERQLELDGRTWRYQVFVPAGQAKAPRPVVLFLHGSGERGSDGRRQLSVGLGPYLLANTDTFPALVVLPQAPEGEEWLGRNVTMAMAALEAASDEFGGDRDRTYLTGMSMGGYGTWETALLHPQRFAALVPVCGALRAPRAERPTLFVEQVAGEAEPWKVVAQRLRHVPVWSFHGADDPLVPPADDRRLLQAARDIGADFHYTEYPGVGHNAWDPAYRDAAMWEWLFAQRR